jgi:hypothetical protein
MEIGMIHDVARRWRGDWFLSLPLSGSAGGVLSRSVDKDGEEFWVSDGRIVDEAWAEAVVRREAMRPPARLSPSRRPEDARRAEELFGFPETQQRVLVRDGDFAILIERMPGSDRFGFFAVLLEIAFSDSDGWAIAHRSESHYWASWSKALKALLASAEETIAKMRGYL